MPIEEVRNRRRRPRRSTAEAPEMAIIRFQSWRKPFIRVCLVTDFMPTVSRTEER